MEENHDQHAHRNLETVEAPLDAAHQSLADALRASFSVLKGIMTILVVLYLFSNVRSIASHEQALVLRLGRLLPGVHDPGLVWAFPFPIDEIIPLPTKKSNDLLITSHTFHRTEQELGKPIAFISRGPGEGLNPTLDGALLTADHGLVHVQWKVTYKMDDVASYVTEFAGRQVEAAEHLIRALVENIGIQVATELTAEEIIRTRVDHVQNELRLRINARLKALRSGVVVTYVEMYEPTPPVQVRDAFDNTQRWENTKQQRIRGAEKERTRILNEAAGAAHERLVKLLEEIDRAGTNARSADALRVELDGMLDQEVEGEAGRQVKNAGAYRAVVVSQMQSDVERYRMLLPEYKRNPVMLINRLWEETQTQILASPGVSKIYRPRNIREFRLKIPRDPDEARVEEEKRLQKKEFDPGKLRREKLVPLGPEHG
jgi:membrane protease subunit HflK